jgi:hypothetical protein
LLGRQEEPPVQITTIRFEQTFNTGNYENQKIAVEATLAAEDDPAQVLGRLRAFVADHDPALVQARAVVAAPDQYSAGAVHKARQRLGLPPVPAPPPPMPRRPVPADDDLEDL